MFAARRLVASRAPSAVASAMRLNAAPQVRHISFDFTDEQKDLHELSKKFALQEIVPVAAHHDETGEFPWDIVRKAHGLGLMNMHIPEEYGGLGLGAVESCIVAENLAYGCSGISTALGGPSLAESPLLVGASHEQKTKYLGRMTEEPLIAAYCVTEPGCGSDVNGIKTTAVQKGSDWVLNGNKMWITGAGHANWFFVLARTAKDAKASEAFTGFIVDADTPGIVLGRKEDNMGQRASDTRAVTFEDVVVPSENVLGEAGKGFLLAMKAFDITRPEVAAGAIGVAQRSFEEATKYSLERKTFGRPIATYQAVSHMLAKQATDIEAARWLTLRGAFELDQGRRPTYYASMAKAFAGELAVRASREAIQIFGGNGYSKSMPVEKLHRDSMIFTIYEGTTQIQNEIISRTLLENAMRGAL